MAVNLQPGQQVCRGKYRLVRLLGQGGFAKVFEAENNATNRRVALKVVHGESAGPEVVARLRREAVVSSRVRHRHVVDVYDLEEEAGLWFLVMEYLSGETLRQALDRGALPPDVASALLISVMRGLWVMHAHGVVHRDIKPENIYLAVQHDSPEVVAKLIDFGICKVAQPDPVLPPVTRAGTQGMGTAAYISPEQYADSADVDARSDIYSMGVVLYECLTGKPPYDAPTQRDVMLKALTTSPAVPHVLCPAVPPALSAVVAKAMARDVLERYSTIAELENALTPFASASAPTLAALKLQPTAASARRRSGWLGAIAALALVQASGIYWAVTGLKPGEPGAELFSPHGNVLAGFLMPPMAVAPASAPKRAADRQVPVTVVCEIPGAELYINGQRIAAVVMGSSVQLRLPPGLHRFEAMRDGQVVASDLQLVQPGQAFQLDLRVPGEPSEAPQPSAALPARPNLALVSTARASAPASADMDASLTRGHLSDVITSHLDARQDCYEAALEDPAAAPPPPGEPATFELELKIAAHGEVTFVRTESAWGELSLCIERAARSWTFPTAAHETQLHFPLVFRHAGPAQLSAAQLSEVVTRSKGMLQRCYSAATSGQRVMRLDVDLRVEPSGAVAGVEIQGDDPEIDDCIARTVRLWRFPAADMATRTRFPVLLLPGA